MRYILYLIKKLTPDNDKLAHFFWGFVYGVIGYFLQGFALMFFTPLLLGVIKEYHDSKDKGYSEFLDVIYTMLPSGIMIIILYIKNGL